MHLRESFSSPHGTPFKLRGFQPYQSRRFSVRIFTNFGISRFPFPPHPNSDYILFYFWRHRRPPRISLGAAWTTNDHFGGILSFSDFPRNHKVVGNLVLSVSRIGFRRNSVDLMRNRCPVISQPSVYSKIVFLY